MNILRAILTGLILGMMLFVFLAAAPAEAKGKHHKKHQKNRAKHAQPSTYYHGSGGAPYVALGDSITRGLGTPAPYPGFLVGGLEQDGGKFLSLYNLGIDGAQAPQVISLLEAPYVKSLNGQARYITISVGFNDISSAWISRNNGTCGGPDNEECYRKAIVDYKANWDKILNEALASCAPGKTNISVGNVYANQFQYNNPVHKRYLEELNGYIASTAAAKNIPVADLHTLFNGPTHDRAIPAGYLADPTHPNFNGSYAISQVFRSLPDAPNCP